MALEDSFVSWAKPPGTTEQDKCDNAVRAIRKAIDGSTKLASKSIKVFAQGSYCNRTNVRQDSDVDVCVLFDDSFFFDVPEGKTTADFRLISPAPYGYPEYKNDVDAALKAYFGTKGVTRGKKAFDVHENTYRIDADAVATFEYRRYANDGNWLVGTAFLPDGGNRIINWPEQNYQNGVAKNKTTGGRFKDVVRILKRLRNKMNDENIAAAKPVPSFLIECLVWNVPNEYFGHHNLTADVRASLAHLFNDTRKFETCSEWGEVNELKYLFRATQAWTLTEAHSFLSAAWDYLNFK
jgi:hypothetical protein